LKTDSELIEGLKSNDAKFYAAFVAVFATRIYNTALNILQNKEEAEEVAQDVFMKIFQTIHSFDGSSSLKTWMYRITVNKSLDALRKRKRTTSWSVFVNFFTDQENQEDQDYQAIEPVHPGIQLEQKEDAEMLSKAIEKLPDRQKAAFVLHQMEDLSYKEIAAAMNITVSAVDSLMSRAKKQLKDTLKNLPHGTVR
jgi:RNA polymerase sigma factor (sigma-70 family)